MIIGALLDLGLSLDFLKEELMKLGLGKPEIQRRKIKQGDISCTRFYLKTAPFKKINLRTKKDIFSLLNRSGLNEPTKSLAKEIFLNLFKAESRVHRENIDRISLNELADIDSVVDIVSTAILFKELRVDKVYSSRVSLGRGFVKTREGTLPLPSPATLELLKDIPISIHDINHELVTPTGASILKTLSNDFGKSPEFTIKKIGYGAASTRREDNIPNMLRVILGETENKSLYDEVFVIEVNLDDTLPLNLEYVIEKLLKEGALDVFISPIIMKKSRPANLLSVIAEERLLERIINVIFDETTTFGVRYFKVKRKKLQKESMLVKTPLGKVSIKVGRLDGKIKIISPEYEDCKKLASNLNIPLRKIYEASKDAFKRGYSLRND